MGQEAAEYSSATNTDPCTTCYLSWDHLGSTRMVTDQNGNLISRHDYMPFGEEILAGNAGRVSGFGATDLVTQKFTGKERDAESGLDYFGARYYGSSLGRFTSPDDGGDQSPANPQSWNLYSYVRNNPLANTDDDGRSVNVCLNDGNGNQQCTQMSNADYTAASQGNAGTNAPTLDQVGMNGDGNGNFNSTAITDSNGNTIGTATYVSDGGADYYANRNGINLLATTAATVGSPKGVAAFYGASAALAACVLYCPEAGAAALTAGRGLLVGGAGLLPAVPSAIQKLQNLGISIQEANELIESPATQKLIDNANGGNINYVADVGGKLIRITTDPSGQRIISAGMMRANQIANGIANGRFTK